jgi:alkanesulfonate monooxygenase SsuD/methylene tetrahydromethanopterin reductase-like flavin-dependent oxidoreductase (luciferase family)
VTPQAVETGKVSVGIHVPSASVTALGSGEAYVNFFQNVESLGLDAVWTEDRIFHTANVLDPLMLLASAAACTRRIQLGTAVLVLNLRNAAVVARQASTLHHLSGGRLALGVSLGGHPEEYRALAVPMERRVAVFRESVTVLRRLLAGQPVDHQGEFFRLEGAAIRPAAPVRVYMGGRAEGALRRAGELADGWIMGPFGTVQDFPNAWHLVKEAARAAGRDPNALVAGRLVYVAVDENRDRARDALRTFLHGYYGPRFDVDQHAIFGPPREVTARLREHVDAGISQLMLGVPTLDLAHLRRVATEVAPALRA